MSAPHEGTRDLHIMIVDDHPAFRRGIEEIARDAGMSVVATAATGEGAIAILRDRGADSIDVVLMDIDLPGMSGIAATQTIVAEAPGLPVVMLTVSTLDQDLVAAIQAGAVGFLSKSLAPDIIVKALRGLENGDSLPFTRKTGDRILGYLRGGGMAAPDAMNAVAPRQTGDLTPREQEVLEQLGLGDRDREIAARLVVTESTVKKHVRSILRKLGVRNRTEAVARSTAASARISPPDR